MNSKVFIGITLLAATSAYLLGIYGPANVEVEHKTENHPVSSIVKESSAISQEQSDSNELESVTPAAPANSKVSPGELIAIIEATGGLSPKQLQESRPYLNQLDQHGMTLFHYALDYENFDLAAKFLELGADPTINTAQGLSPLALSVLGGSEDITTQLLERGLAPNEEVDLIGTTLIMMAALEGQLNVVRALVQYGADVNHQNQKGQTALMKASDMGEKEMVEYLLSQGADPSLKDQHGRSAYDFARHRGLLKLAHLLRWQ